MTSHELARKLLEGPDLLVLKHTPDGVFEIRPPETEMAEKYCSQSNIHICYWPELPAEEEEERFQVITI
jgi:hypothetical protein